MPPDFNNITDARDLIFNPGAACPWMAVACLWSQPKVKARKYPDAAVVAPLRTLRGIDRLVRSLLANPRIRVITVDGNDLSDGQRTTQTLLAVWRGQSRACIRPDISDAELAMVTQRVSLIAEGPTKEHFNEVSAGIGPVDLHIPDSALEDPVLRPPPLDRPEIRAPHGLPGHRIVAESLSDLWVQALREVMEHGIETDSRHNNTFDLLNLVSVLTNPETVYTKEPVSNWTPDSARQYLVQLRSDAIPSTMDEEDRPEYTYGERLTGAYAARSGDDEVIDQVAWLNERLAVSAASRAIYMTTWMPRKDNISGEVHPPCMIGLQWRLHNGELSLTAYFRSHDIFGGYGLNLAALAMWLCAMAYTHGLTIGTLTAMSSSAHVYDRDWGAANDLIADYTPPAMRKDMRSSWAVEWGERKGVKGLIARAFDPAGDELIKSFFATTPARLIKYAIDSGFCTEPGNAAYIASQAYILYFENSKE